MQHHAPFRLRILSLAIMMTLTGLSGKSNAEEAVEFNTQFLDVKGGTKIDLGKFSHKGYVLPGNYNLQVVVNKYPLAEENDIHWYPKEDDPSNSFPCLSPDVISKLGLKPELVETLQWIKDGQCLQPGQIEGMVIQANLSQSQLEVTIPQAWLEYTDAEWDPPSRWDEGIPGLIFDYNMNAQVRHQQNDGVDEHDITANGTVGGNLGAWRLRADWQASYLNTSDSEGQDLRDWEWSRYYAWRALPGLGAKLTLGEDALASNIFDTFNYLGASVQTDDQMLPPNLRGYAPDISGVARTNAKVTVTQQGRVIYESQVPAGPFHIQDINEAVSGDLHVRIEEQSGQVQEYDVSTASIPFLTRQGMVRYKGTVGRPQDWNHHAEGNAFAAGEASWGFANSWSLYGGAVGEEHYQAVAIGIGRDMAVLGALALDVTHSRTQLPEAGEYGHGTLQGNSYRISYAKDFDQLNSRFTFAGYRFSEENYMTMSEYLDALHDDNVRAGHDKEMYTVSYSQNFSDPALNVYLTWNRLTYWDRGDQNNYNLMVSHYFDIGSMKNMSLSLTAYRSEYDNESDDGVYVSLMIPWGNDKSISYNGMFSDDDNSSQVSYYQRLNDRSNYQLSLGQSGNNTRAEGFYSHEGSYADVDVSANYQEGDYTSAGLTMRGGATLTAKGGALHRTNLSGGSRILVDTGGVADVPIGGYNSPVYSNRFGKAVLTDVNDYYRNQIRIDINQLPENAEATQSTVQATLTEGAIGYREFGVISGEKAMAVLRMENGDSPPFGAEVKNSHQQQIGLVDDDGHVYLAGVKAGENLQVYWSGEKQCDVSLPDPLPKNLFSGLLLPCQLANPDKPRPAMEIKPIIQDQTQRITPSAKPEALSDNTY
ncbi:outer membrane usher protein [Escherichia marmotae]|nr:outer membrane usher protein [Escherichia marmotae]